MINVTKIISLLFVVIIILALIFLSRFVRKRINIKFNFLIIGIYIGVLIVLTLICNLLPNGTLLKNNTKWVETTKSPMSTLYKNITTGNFGKVNGLVKTGSYSFTAKGQIFLSTSYIGVASASVTANGTNITQETGNAFFGVKGVDAPDNGDGKIDVYCYTTPVQFLGMDLTSKIPSPKISFSDNVLGIMAPTQKTSDFYQFNDSITTLNDTSVMTGIDQGNEIVVVLLPNGVTLNGGKYNTLKDLDVTEG